MPRKYERKVGGALLSGDLLSMLGGPSLGMTAMPLQGIFDAVLGPGAFNNFRNTGTKMLMDTVLKGATDGALKGVIGKGRPRGRPRKHKCMCGGALSGGMLGCLNCFKRGQTARITPADGPGGQSLQYHLGNERRTDGQRESNLRQTNPMFGSFLDEMIPPQYVALQDQAANPNALYSVAPAGYAAQAGINPGKAAAADYEIMTPRPRSTAVSRPSDKPTLSAKTSAQVKQQVKSDAQQLIEDLEFARLIDATRLPLQPPKKEGGRRMHKQQVMKACSHKHQNKCKCPAISGGAGPLDFLQALDMPGTGQKLVNSALEVFLKRALAGGSQPLNAPVMIGGKFTFGDFINPLWYFKKTMQKVVQPVLHATKLDKVVNAIPGVNLVAAMTGATKMPSMSAPPPAAAAPAPPPAAPAAAGSGKRGRGRPRKGVKVVGDENILVQDLEGSGRKKSKTKPKDAAYYRERYARRKAEKEMKVKVI